MASVSDLKTMNDLCHDGMLFCNPLDPRQFESSGPSYSTRVYLHFLSVLSTFFTTRRVPSLPLFLLAKLKLFHTREVSENIIMTDCRIFCHFPK